MTMNEIDKYNKTLTYDFIKDEYVICFLILFCDDRDFNATVKIE